MVVADEVIKPVKVIVDKSKHPLNIDEKFVTLETLKFDKSKLVIFFNVENIPPISVTFEVLSVDTSNVVNPEQPKNILSMFVTLSVINPVTSNEIKLSKK